MSWRIEDLDKNKTEWSITNEEARLDNCKEILERLKNEYDKTQSDYMNKIGRLNEQISSIETSIVTGEKFIEDCKKHLKDFE